MTKKKEGIKKRNKKRVVISCFWYTQALYTQNEEKKMIRSRAILIYNITYSLLPQILFLRAICEAYTFSSNRTRGKAQNALQSIPPARETDSSKRLFPPPLLPFSPLSFIRRISLRKRIDRKNEQCKEDTCVIEDCMCERERERKHRDIVEYKSPRITITSV